jgi:hypothetical protein
MERIVRCGAVRGIGRTRQPPPGAMAWIAHVSRVIGTRMARAADAVRTRMPA